MDADKFSKHPSCMNDDGEYVQCLRKIRTDERPYTFAEYSKLIHQAVDSPPTKNRISVTRYVTAPQALRRRGRH